MMNYSFKVKYRYVIRDGKMYVEQIMPMEETPEQKEKKKEYENLFE